jgi:hypothetical protein
MGSVATTGEVGVVGGGRSSEEISEACPCGLWTVIWLRLRVCDRGLGTCGRGRSLRDFVTIDRNVRHLTSASTLASVVNEFRTGKKGFAQIILPTMHLGS